MGVHLDAELKLEADLGHWSSCLGSLSQPAVDPMSIVDFVESNEL